MLCALGGGLVCLSRRLDMTEGRVERRESALLVMAASGGKVVIIVVLCIAAAALLAYRFWYDSTKRK